MVIAWSIVPRKRPNWKPKIYLETCSKAENFVKIVQTSDPWGENLWQKFEILTVLGDVFPHFPPINVKFGMESGPQCQISRLSGHRTYVCRCQLFLPALLSAPQLVETWSSLVPDDVSGIEHSASPVLRRGTVCRRIFVLHQHSVLSKICSRLIYFFIHFSYLLNFEKRMLYGALDFMDMLRRLISCRIIIIIINVSPLQGEKPILDHSVKQCRHGCASHRLTGNNNGFIKRF